ncbi:mRNA N(3)-methylcytidine methyltransferase METTL8 [Lampris incognitus]|uniref:mRNA N(3)-methylcytidine methyltransferase METTL8 n=1 Tax=Lampris incognitus TaxID=2546036 RepID=UPI0024B6142B|nr:mRNA N(3)-methylcytidine methyltransferase METTL8 [Lampris incognitus]
MYTCRRLPPALVANVLDNFSVRLNSTGKRPSAPLGSRILTDPGDVFKHNMWDHVQWTEEEKEKARRKAEENSSVRIPLEEQGKYDTKACTYWDRFYETHQGRFFKDRHWLFLEFPELLPSSPRNIATDGCHGGQRASCAPPGGPPVDSDTRRHQHGGLTQQHKKDDTTECQPSRNGEEGGNDEFAVNATSFPGQHAAFRILEAGCGVGNSVFPIVNSMKETGAFLYCCDFSSRAIQLVKDHPDYNPSSCHAFVHDLREETASFPFPPQSLDVILAVFVLSSIHPARMQGTVNRLCQYLKQGGTFLFRDYGRYDFSQLRFKKGRCLSENFYTRGDGTCVYYFTKDEVHRLFSNAGLEEIQNLEDRRLQVNRGRKVVMRRVWMQGKYRKTHPTPPS